VKTDITDLWDLSKDRMELLFQQGLEWKKRRRRGIADRPLSGKTLGLIFDKPSTRTRLSFEAAMVQLGGTPLFMGTKDTQLSRNEPVADTARMLSRYLDAVAIRTFSQDLLTEMARAADIPVINALTDRYHPCQVLSDLLTLIEVKGGYKDATIAWVGDGNNVAHSWINASAILGFSLVLACPEGYGPAQEVVEKARAQGAASIRMAGTPEEAVEGADVIYTDVWASMGQESEAAARQKAFAGYQVNGALLSRARKDAVVMHCLPAHRGEEITGEVLEGPRSVVWDQAENKLHMHKAILEALLVTWRR